VCIENIGIGPEPSIEAKQKFKAKKAKKKEKIAKK
jgi:hypothetical protein